MRLIGRIGALATLVALVLSGCYLGLDEGAGSVGIELPDPRSVSGGADAEFARIFVLNGAVLLDVGDGIPYAEFDLSPTEGSKLSEATVGPVPAGEGYRVVLVFGNYTPGTGTGEFFVPVSYALSDEFTVFGGQATAIDVELGVTPYVAVGGEEILGLDLKGIVFTGSELYVASSNVLFESGSGPGAFAGGITFASIPVPAGKTVNSISRGASDATNDHVVWLNTNNGVLPYTGSFQDGFDTGSGIETTNILDSGAFFEDVGEGDAVYGYLQFDGGLTAVRDQDGAPAPEWMEPSDLSELVAGQPIYDLAVQFVPGTVVYGYFATKLGAFRMPDDVITNPDVDTPQEIFEASDFFRVSINGTPATITEIAVEPLGGTGLYLGTPRGAVFVSNSEAGKIGSVDNVALASGLVPFTEGLIVEDIAVAGSYVAVLTNHYLVYSKDSGSTWARVPVYAGSAGAGEIKGMLLDVASGVVLIAGEGGLMGIDIDP